LGIILFAKSPHAETLIKVKPMVFFQIRLSVLSLLLLIGVVVIAQHTAAPLPYGLGSFAESCDARLAACWLGIVPGQTTPHDAVDLLIVHGYRLSHGTAARSPMMGYETQVGREPCRVELYWSDAHITQMGMYFCEGIRLGDLQALFPRDEALRISLGDAGGSIESYRPPFLIPFVGALSPRATVYAVWLHPLNQLRSSLTFAWSGYAPLWRYCQLQSTSACQ
jgi:hypothetical protein